MKRLLFALLLSTTAYAGTVIEGDVTQGNVVVTKALVMTPVSVTPVGATVTLPATGMVFYSTVSANITSVNFSALADGQSITWVAIASGGPWNITGWTPTARWRFGTRYETLAASTHNIYTIMRIGSTYYIAVADQMTLSP